MSCILCDTVVMSKIRKNYKESKITQGNENYACKVCVFGVITRIVN